MTPVAPLVALRATTWEAALEETLSSTARARGLGDLSVHSVHSHVINIRCGDGLIAVVHDSLDDAPWTIRVPAGVWSGLRAQVNDPVQAEPDGITIRTADAAVRIVLDPADRWSPPAVAGAPSDAALREACAALAAFPAPPPTTAFGRASARLLEAGVEQLRTDSAALLRDAGAADPVARSARRLIGLGEGLTPAGDDILTGLAFVAAHPGFGLSALLPALSAVAGAADHATTALSVVTLRAALAGRARHRLHDLIAAVVDGDATRIMTHAGRTAAIGHTSGHDILTGVRLALGLAAGVRAPLASTEESEGETR